MVSQTRGCIRRQILAVALCVLAVCIMHPAFAQQQNPVGPTVWIMPDWEDSGQCIRDLFTHPEQWSATRPYVDVYEFSSFKYFSDDELRTWFGQLKKWNIKLAVENGAIKDWAPTAEKMIAAETPYFNQIKNDGGTLYALAMDEPLIAVRDRIKKDDDYAAQQTANYITQLRNLVPGILVGDIEPYPAIPVSDQITWIEQVNDRLAAQGQRGLDFYRIDPNWIASTIFGSGSWKDLSRLESYCKWRKIPFSMIYWASGIDGLTKHGISPDNAWYVGAVNQAAELSVAGSQPDQYVIESWVNGAPAHSLPETDPFSFMGSVNEIATHFAKAGK